MNDAASHQSRLSTHPDDRPIADQAMGAWFADWFFERHLRIEVKR